MNFFELSLVSYFLGMYEQCRFRSECFPRVDHISTATNYSLRICDVNIWFTFAFAGRINRRLQAVLPWEGQSTFWQTQIHVSHLIKLNLAIWDTCSSSTLMIALRQWSNNIGEVVLMSSTMVTQWSSMTPNSLRASLVNHSIRRLYRLMAARRLFSSCLIFSFPTFTYLNERQNKK